MPKRKGRTPRTDYSRPRKVLRYSKAIKTSKSKIVQICQKVIDKNTEFKRYVRVSPVVALTNITDGQLLFQGPQLAQGDSALEREGNEVMLRKLRFNVMFKSIGASNRVRIVLVKYSQNVGAAGTLIDVLENVGAQNVMISPWRKNGPVKYQICYNRIHNLGTKTVMDGTYKYQSFKIDVKFPKAGCPLHYEDGTTQNPDKNNFILYAVADQALAAPNTNEINLYTEAVYTDV